MKKRKIDETLFNEINPIITEMGYLLVELNQVLLKGVQRITLVLHKKTGLSMDDCVAVHKVLLPKLEVLNPEKEVYLDILSPGVGRNLKTVEELEVFKGEMAKFLLWEQNEWKEGLIGEIENDELIVLNTDQTEKERIKVNDIQKAKLY